MTHHGLGKRFAGSLLAWLCLAVTSAELLAEGACPCPPRLDPSGGGAGGGGANDPTFAFIDPAPKLTLQQQQAALDAASRAETVPPLPVDEKEAALLRQLSQKIESEPAEAAFATAVGVWKENRSANLKKAVLFDAMRRTHLTQESDLMSFMVAALDNPRQEQEKVAQLARGNGLEKKIAARRLTLLNQNPQTRLE